MQQPHEVGRYLPVGIKKHQSDFFPNRGSAPKKVIGLLLDIIEMKGQSFVLTYVGIDMLKKEGGIVGFCLEIGVRLLVAEKN